MTNEEILNQLRTNIEAEIRREILEKVGASLTGRAIAEQAVAKQIAKTVKPKVAKTSAKPGAKRTPDEILETTEAVRKFIAAHPGANAEAIKAALGCELSVITLPIAKLLASKAISRKGVKRATRYYLKGVN